MDDGIVIRFKIIYHKPVQTSTSTNVKKRLCWFFVYSSNLHIEPLQNLQSILRLFFPDRQSGRNQDVSFWERAL